MIGIGGYAYLRILLYLLPSAYEYIFFAISIWGLVTIIYGGLMALMQDDVKRLLAYSSVSQMGYIIFGVASAYYIGVSGSVLQYVRQSYPLHDSGMHNPPSTRVKKHK
jgi:NADH-quinone oxidoreductase subunit M